MTQSLEQNYQKHHSDRRRGGFAILEKERGVLFKKLVGTGKKVLDLGCRDGVITKYFVEGNDVTGADIDSSSLESINKNLGVKTLHLDIQSDSWPIQPESFDAVVAGELLEHLYFPAEVVARVNKILKPGGLFVGSVPNAYALKNRIKYLFAIKRGTPLEDPMHINQFSWQELEEILKSNFTGVKLYPLGNPHHGFTGKFPAFLAHSIAFYAKKDEK